MLLDGAEQHDQAEDADHCQTDLDTEDAVESCGTLSVDHGAVPGVDEDVGQEADHGEQTSCRTEDLHRDLHL